MVFESLVVDLVNRYLGDFIENLDSSQLKIGIWGGDVVLNNLYIKESALDDLDLPVKVLHGNVGKLTLRIPWKNLYGEPTVANLEGLYVVAVPNLGIKYNEEKEKKGEWDAKQKELSRLEEKKKLESEKNKPKDVKQDSFAEKLATNVIKNLQVNIKDIHVRYEDRYTNPKRPFALGVTLKELMFQTTDENWAPKVIKESVSKIFKMVKLDSLAMYWNSNSPSYLGFTKEQMLSAMQNALKGNITSGGHKTDYHYLIEPISSSAQLQLHTKPELDNFSIPKLLLNVVFEQIGIALNKNQYQDVMEILENFERINLAAKYRKFRPDLPRKGHAKQWWHFAYNCVMEETVRRRRRMWSWTHMKHHRQLCREYKEAYKKKLSSKKITKEVQAKLEECERELSVFNLTLVRQRAELEAKKEGLKSGGGGGGWLSGWWGGGKKEAKQEKDIGEQFQQLMTPEEKAKLYTAIGYQEDTTDPTLPKEFVANKVNFELRNLSVKLKDGSLQEPQVLNLQLRNMAAKLGQRPAASAIHVETTISAFEVTGTPPAGGAMPPVMVTSQKHSEQESLLDAMFETNPLDGACDTRVKLNARPLEIIYNAATINLIADFFKPPESVHLKQLQAAAMAKFEELKEQTATGLQHAIEQRKYTEITVNVQPTHVIVPDTGVYRKDCKMLLLELGQLSVSTAKQDKTPMSPTGLDFDEVMKRAYDKFQFNLTSVQLLFVKPGDDWQAARQVGHSPLHILNPMNLKVDLNKCMIPDIRIPKMRIQGELPKLDLSVSDARLQDILALVDSIPFPEGSPPAPDDGLELDAPDISKMMALEGDASALVRKMAADGESSDDEFQDARESIPSKQLTKQTSSDYANLTDLELQFEIKEICVTLAQKHLDKETPIMKVVIDSLGTEVKVRTFDLAVSAYLGGIYVQHMQFKANDAIKAWYTNADNMTAESGGPLINLVNTPITDEKSFKLLTVDYLKANKKGPEFATTYANTEQKISVDFSVLEVLLHQEAILSLLAFAQRLQPPPKAPKVEAPLVAEVAGQALAAPPGGAEEKQGTEAAAAAAKRRRQKDAQVIDIAVEAKLGVFSVGICTDTQLITDVKIRGLEANVTVQKTHTTVDASLKDITVFDPTSGALYPKILAFEGGEVFRINIVAYNGATDGDNYCDMKVVDTRIDLDTGCMKVVFLNKFVMNLLRFLDQFQAAKDKMVEASAAAAESAKQAAQDFSSKASRLSLSIRMKAPVVVVPRHSASTSAVVVDLGRLNISNSFQIVGQRNQDGVPGVLDKMMIELTSLKLSRALMMGTDMQAECLLLEPVTIKLGLTRNLAAGWYHGHPDIDISGKLESFTVGLSQGDFSTIMGLLNENLTEGQEQASTPPVPVGAAVPPVTQAEVASTTQAPGSQGDQVISPAVAATTAAAATAATTSAAPPTARQLSDAGAKQEPWSKMKFSFTIEQICMELFCGDSNLSTGFSEREARKSLGKIQLIVIGLNGNMRSDSSMEAHVMLHKCVLDDTRPNRENGITKMVERSTEVATLVDPPNMIDLTFIQSARQDKDVQVKVSGLYICVCLEYLMTLGDFFVKGMAPPEPQPGADVTKSGAKPPAVQPITKATVPAKTASAPASPAPPGPPTPQGSINVRLVIDKPEIVLVENPMMEDTNALVLDVHVDFSLKMTPEIQTMMGSIQGLQIVSCIYALEKRESSRSLILSPLDINLHSSAPQSKGHHIDLMVTDVILNISPASIRTITATLSNLSPQKTDQEEEDMFEGIPKDLWKLKPLVIADFWFLKSDDVEEIAQDEAAKIPLAITKPEPIPDVVAERREELLLNVDKIVVKMEGGVGKRTVPFILTEMTFRAEVKDWSSQLFVSADLSLEVASYNEKLAVWEPVVEPLEGEDGRHRPYEVNLQVTKNDPGTDEYLDLLDESDAGATPTEPPPLPTPIPKMTIKLSSEHMLQTSFSKSCLEVLTNLGKSFSDAYRLVEVTDKPGEVIAPYVVQNRCGMNVMLRPDDSFMLPDKTDNAHVQLFPDETAELFDKLDKQDKHVLKKKKSIMTNTQDKKVKVMYVVMEEYGVTRELKVQRAEKRAFGINQKAYPGTVQHLVCQTDVAYGCKKITLRSILQVKNNLPFAVEIYHKMSDEVKGRCGEVEPDKVFNVPLHAVYAAPYELFFKPRDPKYNESKNAFKWKDLAPGSHSIVTCEPSVKAHDTKPLHFNVEMAVEDILFEHTGETSAKTYTLTLHPAMVFRNLLPLPVTYTLEGTVDGVVVEPGERSQIMHAKVGEATMELQLKYLGKDWMGKKTLENAPDDLSVCSFDAYDGSEKTSMDLGVHCTMAKGYQEMSLYCPYWMINKTGRELTYKAGEDFSVIHPSDNDGAVLFSFKSKSFFAKKKDDPAEKENGAAKKGSSLKRKTSLRASQRSKSKSSLKKTVKASLKLGDSEWSDKFSLDTVGSSGTVSCKFKGFTYTSDTVGRTLSSSASIGLHVGVRGGQDLGHVTSPDNRKSIRVQVGVKISLGSSGLTKIVTFTPYYLLINQAKFPVHCKENAAESKWIDVPANECIPFWPEQSAKKLQMVAKVNDAAEETKPFYFNQAHTTLMALSNDYGGLNVECQCMESAVNVVFQPYRPGCATALLINHTELATIEYYQNEVTEALRLGPSETIMFTWPDALEKRDLVWSCGETKKQKNDLLKDGEGHFFYNSDTKLFWVSFLDGTQRVLMFTDDLALALKAEQAGDLEDLDQEIEISLQGLGLSLVDNDIQKEIAYMGITSSGAIWEEKKKKNRYKALKSKLSVALEEAWLQYELARDVTKGQQMASRVTKTEPVKLDVDFAGEVLQDRVVYKMFKPSKATIRRSYEQGIWLQYRTSARQQQIHMKIHRLQLDNQIPGAVFPTVLAPIPPPKSVAAESVPKPFTEVSIMIRKREFSSVLQYKYFKVLVQEMAVKVDQGFLTALMRLFSSGKVDEQQEKEAFLEDCRRTETSLMSSAVQSSLDEQKHYYDIMHFSPLKVHLSFSLYGSSGVEGQAVAAAGGKPPPQNFNVLSLFLQSIGVVLTDIDDVVFKLGYFERNYMFYNKTQLTGEFTRHYTQQAIKQMYVLVLGLDVLGNPFGVIRGLAEGIEDLFYEPYQGAVQGPEEFAEGLALGVRSLVGHAVGGAAGAVSRITGALGKGIATLTMDDDYQRKRREQLNKKPADLKEGLARGGKGLVMGVVDGVTGIVMKPVEGAKQEGVEGFFKGVGKGLVGAFTRPASGVVDFASSSFEGIRRAADMSDEVRRLRPPRFIHNDGVLRPYVYREAEGNEILRETEKGKFADSDHYMAHVIVTKDGKNVLLVTDKRVVFVQKGEIFGHWDCEWTFTWEELKEKPTLTSKGVQILLKEKQKKSFFSSGTVGKLVPIQDKKAGEWIVERMQIAMQNVK